MSWCKCVLFTFNVIPRRQYHGCHEFHPLNKISLRYVPMSDCQYGPLARYVKLRVAHALGIQGTFSPPPQVNDPDMHHGTCVTHVPWCMPGSLISDLPWRRWRGKRSRRMRNPQFYVSGKRPIGSIISGNDLILSGNQAISWTDEDSWCCMASLNPRHGLNKIDV